MRTESGLTYEIRQGGGQTIVACTCWIESAPVLDNLDTHWLRRLAQEYTLVITHHRGLAGSSGRADFASELLGLREVVDEVGAPAVILQVSLLFSAIVKKAHISYSSNQTQHEDASLGLDLRNKVI